MSSEQPLNSSRVKFGDIIPTRWHEAGVFRCKSIHTTIADAPKRRRVHQTQSTPSTPKSEVQLGVEMSSTNMLSRRDSTLSSSATSSMIQAFDEGSSRVHRNFEDADNKTKIKLHKRVYGTMLKNNLAPPDDKLYDKHPPEKKPIDAYNAGFDCSANSFREIKSTKIQNSSFDSTQYSNSNKSQSNVFELSENIQTMPTSKNQFDHRATKCNNFTQMPQRPPPRRPKIQIKQPETTQIRIHHENKHHSSQQSLIPIPKKLTFYRPEMQANKPALLTTFSSPTAERSSYHVPTTKTKSLEQRLSVSSLQDTSHPHDSSHHQCYRVRSNPEVSNPNRPSISSRHIEASPAPDPPKGRARNHVIFICVLLCVITVAVVCVVWFLSQGKDKDESSERKTSPHYRVLKIKVTFNLVNDTSTKVDTHRNGFSLKKMERVMSSQIDEMFLRSNLSTKYCGNTVQTNRGSSDVKSTITLSDDDGVVTTSGDVTSALESLIVLTGHHGNQGPEMAELSPCLGCIAIEYATSPKRPKILLYHLSVT